MLEQDFSDEKAHLQLDTAIDWGRYAELFTYDDGTGEFSFGEEPPHHRPVGSRTRYHPCDANRDRWNSTLLIAIRVCYLTVWSSPPRRLILLALVASILMFCGWVLAILPAFTYLQNIVLVAVIALIGFGLVLIPAGLDFVWFPSRPNQKRGAGVLLISVLPGALLFLLTVAILPLSFVFRVAAVIIEFLGVAIYSRV